MRASLAVIHIAFGPLQIICALLPALLVAAGTLALGIFKASVLRQMLHLAWRMKFTLLLLGAIVTAAFLFVARPSPPKAPTEIVSPSRSADWPMFRGGPHRTGSLSDSDRVASGDINWTAKGLKTIYSSCAIAGGRVYLTSAEKGPLRDRGSIYSLDAHSGQVLWQSSPERMRATFSSPAISGRYLVCGEGLHDTERGRVICVDIQRQGATLWQFETQSHVESSPCIANQRVYVGAGDDGYYCLTLDSLPDGRPNVIWHAAGTSFPDAESSPVVVDGKMYAGLGEGGNAIVCLDAATGRALWKIPTPFPVFASPSVLDGKLYVAMGNGTYVQTAAEIARERVALSRKSGQSEAETREIAKQFAEGGEVWCIDTIAAERQASISPGEQVISAESNVVRWSFKLSATVLGAVAIHGHELYFASRDGNVYCLSTDGKERSRWAADEPILTSVAVTSQYVFAVTQSGRLCALQRPSLELLWETSLGSAGPFISSPTVAFGHIYVGSPHQGLICAGRPNRSPATNDLWSAHIQGAESAIGAPAHYHQIGVVALERPPRLVAFDRPTGHILWERGYLATKPPMLHRGQIYLPTSEGTVTVRLLDGQKIGVLP
jgi:outer membrane protein assembly factor BamB